MAESPDNDEELLRQLSKGKEAAFDVLYERYQGRLFRFAWHMTRDHGTAEEVTQEVFLQLIRNPESYDPARGPLAAYMFGIARNLTRRSRKRNRFDETSMDESSEYDAATLPNSTDLLFDLGQQELLEHLRKALLALPDQYREAVVLCDLEEMNYAEAAVLLQCAPGTVASRLHRAKQMLRSRFRCRGVSDKMYQTRCAK